MSKTETYTGPWPRKRHSHTCQSCKRRRNQGAVACYKSHCSLPQSIEHCSCCGPLTPSVTYNPPAPWECKPAAPAPEVKEIAQWYTLIPESQRCAIFYSLSENQRKQAFRYGLAVSWQLLPGYARDLVTTEWWNNSGARQAARENIARMNAPQAPLEPTSALAPDDDGGRTLAGNTPTCEDCGESLDHCKCDDDSQLSLFGARA